MRIYIFIILTLCSLNIFAKQKREAVAPEGLFSARISKLNKKARLIRLRVQFKNIKYVNKNDSLEIWDPQNGKNITCQVKVMGKSNEYLLVRPNDFDICQNYPYMVVGGYVKVFGQDLVNNLKMGRAVMEILAKKKFAVGSKIKRKQEELDSYLDKIEAINLRYEVLRERLEKEWRSTLSALEEDKTLTLSQYKGLQYRMQQIEAKLEQYKITDKNMEMDRWSLDPKLYFLK